MDHGESRRSRNFFQRRDPRAKILMVTGVLVVVLSEPRGSVSPFAAYYVMVAVLLLAARTSPGRLGRRMAAVAPLVLVAAALIVLAGGGSGDTALSVLLRAFAAVALLTLLVDTEDTSSILWGIGALGMPNIFTTQSAFMLRFSNLLGQEAARTERARRSRTPGRLRTGWFRTLGQQAALIFLRGWRRSQRVYQAMLARGFTGRFPAAPRGRMGSADVAFVVFGVGAFTIVRLVWRL